MEHFWDFNIGQIGQALFVVASLAMIVQSLKDSIKDHARRLTVVESKLDGVTNLMIGHASHEERLIAMDARMLAQGQRLDSQSTFINGRLEAINNIVSGHTAQLNNLPRHGA